MIAICKYRYINKLTCGKSYKLIDCDYSYPFFSIINDAGQYVHYMSAHFYTLKELRKIKLQNLNR